MTHGDDVLLLKGAPEKRIWAGKYNGVGGHVERDEDIKQAARREIIEETGLEVTNLTLRGIVTVDAGDADRGIGLFIFTATANSRETRPSPEGTPEWHAQGRLPTTDLADDLPVILPRLLAMETNQPPFFARYWYDDDDKLHISFTES